MATGGFKAILKRFPFFNRSTQPQPPPIPFPIPYRLAGVPVTAETALQVATVFACVRYIAESIGALPWGVYQARAEGAGADEYRTSPLWRLLHTRPNPEMGSLAFRETLTAWALTWGNGYAEIERDTVGRPAALWPISPDRVEPKRDPETGALYYEIGQGRGPKVIMAPRDIYHVHGLGWDGTTGYSVIQLAARSLGTGLASDAFTNAFFGNSTVVGGVLEHPDALSDKAYERLKKAWIDRHGGPGAAWRPDILEEGMKWKNIGMPLKDAEYLATRKFTVNEICRWFRVPPHKVADLERATFSNIEAQSIEVVTDTLLPWVIRHEQEADFKLIGQPGVFTKMNLRGLLRGDAKSRAEYYKAMREMGVFSVNDIRMLEDLNPIGPEGNVRVMQAQYVPLDQVGQQPAAPAAPAAAEDDE